MSQLGVGSPSRRPLLPAPLAWLAHAFAALPTLVRVGFVIVVAGGVIDVGYHLFLARSGAPGGVDRVGYAGHVITLVGMVVSMVGVFRAAPPRS